MTVELVRRADQRRRWYEVGRVLFADEPRWAPPLAAYERWLFSRRHPWLRAGAVVARFLVRRGGHVVGRIAAHHRPDDDDAWFGAVECADDPALVRALVGAAADWADGAKRLRGPALYTPADGDAGVLVSGFEHPGGTGRPWHPPHYADHLAAVGLVPDGDALPRWRLATGVPPTTPTRPVAHTSPLPLPPHAGRLVDRGLVLPGIAAVPDVSAVARGHRIRRPPPPTEAAVVHLEGDPAVLVPALLAAAHDRGYAHVWSPWCPDPDRPPDTLYRLLVADRNSLT